MLSLHIILCMCTAYIYMRHLFYMWQNTGKGNYTLSEIPIVEYSSAPKNAGSVGTCLKSKEVIIRHFHLL
jgi:hypothetical protein